MNRLVNILLQTYSGIVKASIFSDESHNLIPMLRMSDNVIDKRTHALLLLFRNICKRSQQRNGYLLFQHIHSQWLSYRIRAGIVQDIILYLESIAECNSIIDCSLLQGFGFGSSARGLLVDVECQSEGTQAGSIEQIGTDQAIGDATCSNGRT